MEYVYHVTNAGIPIGTNLQPDYQANKPKISVFFRALCQGTGVFCASLAAAQYTDAMLNISKGSPNASKWATEGLFDFVRVLNYHDKPPRFNCIYAFRGIEEAEQFITENRISAESGIYKCSISGCNMFESDMSIFTDVNLRINESQINPYKTLQTQLSEIIEIVKTYWQIPKTIKVSEILLSGGTVRVIDRIK